MTELSRRGFLAGFVATASGLLMPEPTRVYSFLPGLRLADFAEVYWNGKLLQRLPPGMMSFTLPRGHGVVSMRLPAQGHAHTYTIGASVVGTTRRLRYEVDA